MTMPPVGGRHVEKGRPALRNAFTGRARDGGGDGGMHNRMGGGDDDGDDGPDGGRIKRASSVTGFDSHAARPVVHFARILARSESPPPPPPTAADAAAAAAGGDGAAAAARGLFGAIWCDSSGFGVM